MEYLMAVRTVDDAAAVCDYMQNRLEADDVVTVATVHPPDAETPDSDRREALNVAEVRLADPEVETVERRGDEVEELTALIDERDVGEVAVGRGTGGRDGHAGPSRSALEGATDARVTVVPVPPS